jgi:hypothetical protein
MTPHNTNHRAKMVETVGKFDDETKWSGNRNTSSMIELTEKPLGCQKKDILNHKDLIIVQLWK